MEEQERGNWKQIGKWMRWRLGISSIFIFLAFIFIFLDFLFSKSPSPWGTRTREGHRVPLEYLIIKRRHHIVHHGHRVQLWTRRIRIVLGSKELILANPCVLRHH
jgi:hypothetical protein